MLTTKVGTPLKPYGTNRYIFKLLLKEADISPIRFHGLRHSCLSLSTPCGEPICNLQALAGHATAAFTLQGYTHHYDSSAKRTAGAVDDIFPDYVPPCCNAL